MTTMGLPSL
jgi:hypothetical protein